MENNLKFLYHNINNNNNSKNNNFTTKIKKILSLKNFLITFISLILAYLSAISCQSSQLDSFTPEQLLTLFEANYVKAKKDLSFQLYHSYFKQRLTNSSFIDTEKYKGYDEYFISFDKSSQLFYYRNPPQSYKIAFPNENYYLWRIMVTN